MRHLHEINRVLGPLVSILVVIGPPARAPVCLEGRLSVEREYRKSSGVFIGRVIDSRGVPESKDYLDGTVYSVRIEEVLRGEFRDTVEVFSENTSGRFPMDVGTRYLLFVYADLGRTMVDNCGNSGPLSAAADVLKTVRRLRRESGRHG